MKTLKTEKELTRKNKSRCSIVSYISYKPRQWAFASEHVMIVHCTERHLFHFISFEISLFYSYSFPFMFVLLALFYLLHTLECMRIMKTHEQRCSNWNKEKIYTDHSGMREKRFGKNFEKKMINWKKRSVLKSCLENSLRVRIVRLCCQRDI